MPTPCLVKLRDMRALAQVRRELALHPRLVYLFFELTDCCNLACFHCGSRCTSANDTFLPAEDVLRVLERVKSAYGVRPMICVTGGEPMMHPRFFEIVRRVREMGFRWGMTTNGTLVTEETAPLLYAAGLGSVTVSLDGARADHDALRGVPGAYDRAVRGIRCLLKHRARPCKIQATTVVHRGNYAHLEEIFSLMQSLGVDSWRVINMEPIGRALEHRELLLDGEQLVGLLDFIRRKRFDPRVRMEVCFGCSHYLTPAYERMVRDGYFFCGSGLTVASVLANGDIFSCLDIERRAELIQGNIHEDDFVDVFEHRFAPFRAPRDAQNETCRACPDAEFCAGDSSHTWDWAQRRPMLCLKQIIDRRQTT